MFNRIIAGILAFCAAAGVNAAEPQLFGHLTTTAPQPEWVKNAVIYEVNLRQGTPQRTINGFAEELPRLKDLGVDILWVMPIHPISEVNRKGELGSYYAVADYKAFNPEFGTLDDFKNFVNRAHELGMKVIIDEVCNHSGCDNPWIAEHPDFYAKDENGNMFGPFDWTDTYKFDYSNPAMREAMIDALLFWVRDADIDGFRFDVAGQVPVDFWEQARTAIQAVKPVLFLAEASDADLMVNAMDADYAWPMKDVFNAIANTQGVNAYAREHGQILRKLHAEDIDKLLEQQAKEYPQGAIHMQMVTNHDLNSWEGTEFERYGDGLKAFAILSYTLPGMPMLYTGQEVGNTTAFEFFKHDSVPDYTPNEWTAFYRALNALKHDYRSLDAGLGGGAMRSYATSSPDVYVFERFKEGGHCPRCKQTVTVITNLSSTEQPLSFTDEAPIVDGTVDYLTGEAFTLPTTLQPWQTFILVAAPTE